ncbi:MAG: hypothetical protein RIR62_300 [Pseudomonadota bacterium]|jgi:hypothetical protein
MQLNLATGPTAIVPDSLVFGADEFGYNYTGFRAFDRFLTQLDGSQVGLITWPGGAVAELQTDRFGLEYEGLWNGSEAAGNLAEVMEAAIRLGAGLSIVLPTVRYLDRPEALVSDVRGFMADLLGGQYGPLPDTLILEIGSEYYATYRNIPDGVAEYARIADTMLREIDAAVADPTVNLLGADPEIAMQAGRTVAEDEVIRDHLSDDALRSVDMVLHHRFAVMATGVDRTADEMGEVLDNWEEDMASVGGERPGLFLGTYNVASYTRGEALRDYVADMAAQGITIDRDAVDLEGRTDTAFETYWQNRLVRYDYGAEHPRVMLEMMAEYGAEGLGAAGTYGTDMMHAARLTHTDADGMPVRFVGQDMLDMMAESIGGTRLLDVSTGNDGSDDVWVYGFENAHKIILFLSADDLPPGMVTIGLEGFPALRSVQADSLTSAVPEDWMDRFGIADNPLVDETPESRSFALGIRAGIDPSVTQDGISILMDQPHQVIRLAFAKDDTGAAEIAAWSDGTAVDLTDFDGGPPLGAGAPMPILDGDDPLLDDDPDEVEIDDGTGGGGMGVLGLFALLPLLLMGAA